jgi:hypothetical protein
LKPLLILLAAVAAWFAFSEAGTEAWFRWHEARAQKTPEWEVIWPDDPKSTIESARFEDIPVTESVREILRLDRARFGRWVDGCGNMWNVNVIEWNSNMRLNGTEAVHNPTTCMVSAGNELKKDHGTIDVEVDGTPIQFRSYEFENGGRTFYIFTSVLKELAIKQARYAGSGLRGRSTRLEAVAYANHQGPKQVVHIGLIGPRTFEGAKLLLKSKLPQLIRGK